MFVDLTRPERDAFLSQTSGCLIPGYTGHCPTLKFKIGKRYGANTQEIMKELSDRGVLKRHFAHEYRQPDPLQAMLTDGKFSVIEHSKGQTRDLKIDSSNRCRRYILGYTGYIPGMHFRYGTSFRRAADLSVSEFSRRMSQEASRRALEGAGVRARSRSAPRLASIRARDQVRGALDQYCQHNKSEEAHITPEFPPIAGYTGHIPRVKGTEASLSQRYHTAAKRGLTLLRQAVSGLARPLPTAGLQ
ncbi:protein FAM166B-like isoform X2 [Macrosteles quadrilineatus]|uniref:protein FAM166B-like isoform X2 n=1 Tax=Macrosteles quadrilineatus TaxID=74068 RepID=UPI0023E0EB6A|nr:protein FAM166B-like isoform X2 [Macrosteles quadrilineatus]